MSKNQKLEDRCSSPDAIGDANFRLFEAFEEWKRFTETITILDADHVAKKKIDGLRKHMISVGAHMVKRSKVADTKEERAVAKQAKAEGRVTKKKEQLAKLMEKAAKLESELAILPAGEHVKLPADYR